MKVNKTCTSENEIMTSSQDSKKRTALENIAALQPQT